MLLPLLNALNIGNSAFNRQFMEKLSVYPDEGSAYAVSGAFSDSGIPNMVVRLEWADLPEVETACLFQFKDASWGLLKRLAENQIVYIDDKGKETALSKEAFEDKWQGIVVLVDKPEKKIEVEQSIFKPGRLGIPPLALWALIPLLGYAFFSIGWNMASAVFALSAGGLALSGLMLAKQYGLGGGKSALADLVCGASPLFSCEEALQSGGKYWKFPLSLSDLAFLFSLFIFSYLYAAALFGFRTDTLFWVLAGGSVFTLYTVWLQIFRTKKLCPICMGITLILWAETVLSFFMQGGGFGFDYGQSFAALSVFCLLAIALVSIKPFLGLYQEKQKAQKKLMQFLIDPQTVESLLSSNQNPEADINAAAPIVFGNALAENSVLLVLSPLCPPCAQAYQKMELLLKEFGENIRFEIVFMAGGQPGDKKVDASLLLLALTHGKSDGEKSAVLDGWFAGGSADLAGFAKKHPAGEAALEDQREPLKKQTAFAELLRAEYTPTVYINGQKVALILDLADLRYYLRHLVSEAG